MERLILATFASSASLTRLELEELTGLTATLMVVPGEFTDAERYGALAAADAHAVALASEGPARERISALITRNPTPPREPEGPHGRRAIFR